LEPIRIGDPDEELFRTLVLDNETDDLPAELDHPLK
jgi:hypothetical protein